MPARTRHNCRLHTVRRERKGDRPHGHAALVSREIYELQTVSGLDADDPYRQVFTLYYTALSDERTEVRFVVVDNFGRERELEVSFDSERQ
ncbi:TraQ conjugal transfer family protein [Alistipes dispar]|uniref:TraQ conjugal transfer family protein n=1 Tax=Alistipes dispar TaxID=2585119 RepID=UPI003A8AFD3B